MAGTTKDNGRTTRWKAMVSSHGLMEEDMRESILMIKKKEMEFSIGMI
jgi:hypothetical protein